jgi:arsenate reductase (thioredoxin)
MARQTVLVMCTGNSARSQIAEAYLKRYAGDRMDVVSAGTEPAPAIHPLAREVLREDGFEIAGQRPKHYREFLGTLPVHTLIVVCDTAARDCPAVWPGIHQRLHWPFEDPAAFEGERALQLAKFREIRDAIKQRVRAWAAAEAS